MSTNTATATATSTATNTSTSTSTSTSTRPGPFWLTALLALPVLNIVAMSAAWGPMRVSFGLAAAGLAAIDFLLLVALAQRYGMGVLEAVVGLVVSAMMTAASVYALIFAYVAACNGCMS